MTCGAPGAGTSSAPSLTGSSPAHESGRDSETERTWRPWQELTGEGERGGQAVRERNKIYVRSNSQVAM